MSQDAVTRVSKLQEDIDDAVCLLALLTKRVSDQDESKKPTEERIHAQRTSCSAEAPQAKERDPTNDLDDSSKDGIEDEADEEPDSTFGIDQTQNDTVLYRKFLDRLAETLARFKSDPSKKKAPDSKHVASILMTIDKDNMKTKIFCFKNEGLDKQDEDFLERWKICMVGAARAEKSDSVEHEENMFDIVYRHQRSRIQTYLMWLRRAFKQLNITKGSSIDHAAAFASALQRKRILRTRKWIDHTGRELSIPVAHADRAGQTSQYSLTTDSVQNAETHASNLFSTIESLCQVESYDNQHSLIRKLIIDTFWLWKKTRSRSAIKSILHRRFPHQTKERNGVEKTLLFLSRIYNCTHTFVKAAAILSSLRSIECVPVFNTILDFQHPCITTAKTPLETARRLGLSVTHSAWIKYLDINRARFATIRQEKHNKFCIHAELQALHHYSHHLNSEETWTVYPYIGCSRRCCFLCYCFVLAHGGFGVRGTHETIFHRWEIPSENLSAHVEQRDIHAATERLLNALIKVLGTLFSMPFPLHHRVQLPQSSHALSSATFYLETEMARLERPKRELQRMMMMNASAFDDGILVCQNLKIPELAFVTGGRFHKGLQMTVGKVESIKDSHIREKLGLEGKDGQLLTPVSVPQKCKLCRILSGRYCSACRMIYCSRRCQVRDWRRHLFVCCVGGRPNDVDRLSAITRWFSVISRDSQSWRDHQARLYRALFSDDNLCKIFGFNNCADELDVRQLLCIYQNLVKSFSSPELQRWINSGQIGDLVHRWVIWAQERESCHGGRGTCHQWFLKRRAQGFPIPNHEGQYVHQIMTTIEVDKSFYPHQDVKPSPAEKRVWSLYTILLRDFDNIPDACEPAWLLFGFCYCTEISQQEALRATYLSLLEKKVTLAQIAEAWEAKSLLALMYRHGIETAQTLNLQGIHFHQPPTDEMGIYRLMVEVKHALSGSYCRCFKDSCRPRSHQETLLSLESEGDYGFHGSNSWERWQLINFYCSVFAHPSFRPCDMQDARRDPDPKALDQYLDRLIPNYETKMFNKYLCGGLFPRLGSRIEFRKGRPDCTCVLHRVIGSEGRGIPNFDSVLSLTRANIGDGAGSVGVDNSGLKGSVDPSHSNGVS